MTPQIVVLRIQSVLSGKSDISQLQKRSLAAEYKGMCEAAASKLETCAALIRAGRDYAALQIAETQPQLLDTINALSFNGSKAWMDFCNSESFPVPAEFDEYQIELVNGIYSKHITQTHPLYRDFRRAMRLRNMGEALSIITTISKINANDAQARNERDKLSKKFALMKIDELKEAMARGDDAETLSLCRTLRDFDQTYIGENKTWEGAQERFKELERRAASERAREIISALRDRRAEFGCDEILAMASEFQILRSSNGLTADQADCDMVDKITAEAAEEHDRKSAEALALKARNQIIIELENPTKFPSPKTFLAHLRRLQKQAGGTLDADIKKRLERKISQIGARIFRRRLAAAAMCLAILAVAAGAFGALAFGQMRRAKSASAQMHFEAALAVKKIDAAQKALADFEDEFSAAISASDAMSLKISERKRQMLDASDTLEKIRSDMDALSKFDFNSTGSARWQGAFDKLDETQAAAEELEKKFDTGMKSEINELKRLFLVKIDDRKRRIKTEVDAGFKECESLIKALEGMPQNHAQIAKQLEGRLAELKPLVEDTSALFKLNSFDVEKYAALSAAFTDASSKQKDYDAQKFALLRSTGVDDYLSKLSSLGQSNLIKSEMAAGINAMISRGKLLKTANFEGICTPEEAAKAAEIDQFLRSADIVAAPFLKDVWRYLKAGKPVYTLGKVEEAKSKWSTGSEVIQKADEITLGGKTKQAVYRLIMVDGKLPKGDLLTNETLPDETKLAQKIEAESALKPAIENLSLIYASNVNSVFRLYVESLMLQFMAKEPEKSGLAFSPSARARMKKIEGYAKELSVYSWMFETQSKARLIEDELYKTPEPDFLAEASANKFVAAGLAKNPMKIVGFVDESGRPSFDDGVTGKLWGIAKDDGAFKVLYKDGKETAKPALWTPLLLEKVSRQSLIEESKKLSLKDAK